MATLVEDASRALAATLVEDALASKDSASRAENKKNKQGNETSMALKLIHKASGYAIEANEWV
ncbi:hypothetical protein F3Y22_tig00110246pilonHSYRG00012 [Hibiscus syriacus]|uniref:Uncharacterized protein n=1 Tax=Hibiscus syriacus TaxID=106335 RepID=A0A6A3B6H0_HIBSY|nr:hypothetical protein F3Y22_tig00110246pilonHSYRG00012 [Hibiscus syriacus]